MSRPPNNRVLAQIAGEMVECTAGAGARPLRQPEGKGMRIVLAALIALAAAPADAQHEQAATPDPSPYEVAADTHWRDRSNALNAALDQMKAKKTDAALAGYSTLINEYERLYAGEKRTLFCAENESEARAYIPALTSTEKATFVEKFWCTALWGKAFTLIDAERYSEALPYLTRAVAMGPKRAQYLTELGFAYRSIKDFQKSLDLYTRAVDTAPLASDADVALGRGLRGMGFDLIELGRWDEAEAAYRKALTLNPNDDMSRSELDYIAKNRPKRS
jgi:tetratricopeptide (TPR) repeat protein